MVIKKSYIKYEKCSFFLEKKNADICYTGYSAFYNNKIVYRPTTPLYMNYYNFLKECPICCSSVLIKKKILNRQTLKLSLIIIKIDS